jgi:RNA polymerase sigma factor (sigma-70 family)
MKEDVHDASASVEVAGSVTRLIGDLKAGDPRAADELWKRYFHRIIGLAQAKIRKLSSPGALVDEEDAAQSAFYSLCQGAAEGRFDKLGDRDDLWRLLVVLTSRKAADHHRRETRQKRGGGRVIAEHDLDLGDGSTDDRPRALEQIASTEPTPEFAAMLVEEFERRLSLLGKDSLRQIALLRMEGYSNEEIAAKTGCALRTVSRRLEMIRAAWSAEEPESDGDGPA